MNRIAGAAVIVMVLVGVRAAVPPLNLQATASARWDGRYEATNAIDGSDVSDWLLPDGQTGWIEVTISPPRFVKHVRVLNARNLPHADRATVDYELEGISGGQVVSRSKGRFAGFSRDVATNVHDVGAKLDKVRITVKSYDSAGGGFAEIELE